MTFGDVFNMKNKKHNKSKSLGGVLATFEIYYVTNTQGVIQVLYTVYINI